MSSLLKASDTRPLDGGPSFSLANRLERIAFRLCWLLLASWTPPSINVWRIFLLRRFGATVHSKAAITPSTKIWLPRNLTIGANSTLGPGVNLYNMAPIVIGERTIVSQGAYLCAGSHDVDDPHFQLITRPISIGDNVWIAAEAFVGPGVKVGDGAVLGARGVAFADLEPWRIYRGNPASPLRDRRRYSERV